MILTVTLNPSIDISYLVPDFHLDQVQRCQEVHKVAGGKGINVTKVLHQLGAPVKATGFLGGHFGDYLADKLSQANIQHDFITISDETRQSIAILHDHQQTEILESGPLISPSEAQAFLKHFPHLLAECQILTLSGSLPKGLSPEFYQELISLAQQENVKVLFDSSGQTLIDVLTGPARPFLIKPNDDEISQITGRPFNLDQLNQCKADLNIPLFADIEWLVISLGADGAFIKHRNQFYRVSIPKIEVVSPVGSGDATVAGLAWALHQAVDDDVVIKTGMTCGILNTMQAQTGHIDPQYFDQIYKQIRVEAV
ncbi:hexose kinase [Vaginisenegalia massiliensis]|uniref:hexose kinase n=1 Tax=Vaginisenegalia massiliensis TaxID=2058294 RepID=UPI000F54B419|nr:hexose kinase [Vaginisenegalia massiliensis]